MKPEMSPKLRFTLDLLKVIGMAVAIAVGTSLCFLVYLNITLLLVVK